MESVLGSWVVVFIAKMIMMSVGKLLLGLSVLASLSSCASKKSTVQTKITNNQVSSVSNARDKEVASRDIGEGSVKRTDEARAELDSVKQINNLEISPNVLTPAEKVALIKAEGIDKNYDFAPTVHYDLRKPQFVMIHHTSQNSIEQTIRTFQLDYTKVSAHYVISRAGVVVQMLNDYDRSWHAGAGKWGQVTDMNSASIGVELDNNGNEPFPPLQINALIQLLSTLKEKYKIPQLNFIGHADYAPKRKNDPSSFFPWRTLAENGFGIWYNESYLLEPPIGFNSTDALRIMGYDTTNLPAAISAFKRKYNQWDTLEELTPRDLEILYDLYRKFY